MRTRFTRKEVAMMLANTWLLLGLGITCGFAFAQWVLGQDIIPVTWVGMMLGIVQWFPSYYIYKL